MSQSSSMNPIALLSKNLHYFFMIDPKKNMNTFLELSSVKVDNKVRKFCLIRQYIN